MNLNDAIEFILTDSSLKSNEGMNKLITAVNERQKINRHGKGAGIRIGMKVKLCRLKPKYWNGMIVEVVSFNQTRTRADVKIIDNKGQGKAIVGSTRKNFPLSGMEEIVDATFTAPTLTSADANALLDFMEGR